MNGVVREVNVRVLGKGLELLSVNGGCFEINQLLFADDTALVADSEEKLCKLVSEFGRVCERRKLSVNVITIIYHDFLPTPRRVSHHDTPLSPYT